MATRGDCLHIGVSLLLCVESNVPILFTRSVPRLFIKLIVPRLYICRIVHVLFIHSSLREEASQSCVTIINTRRRVFESFKSDCP